MVANKFVALQINKDQICKNQIVIFNCQFEMKDIFCYLHVDSSVEKSGFKNLNSPLLSPCKSRGYQCNTIYI